MTKKATRRVQHHQKRQGCVAGSTSTTMLFMFFSCNCLYCNLDISPIEYPCTAVVRAAYFLWDRCCTIVRFFQPFFFPLLVPTGLSGVAYGCTVIHQQIQAAKTQNLNKLLVSDHGLYGTKYWYRIVGYMVTQRGTS